MSDYIVKNWTQQDGNGNPRLLIASDNLGLPSNDERNLWKILDAAKRNEMKISVFALGECVLDWS